MDAIDWESVGPDLRNYACELLALYVALANTGDCGFWDPEAEPEVIGMRGALKAAGVE